MAIGFDASSVRARKFNLEAIFKPVLYVFYQDISILKFTSNFHNFCLLLAVVSVFLAATDVIFSTLYKVKFFNSFNGELG